MKWILQFLEQQKSWIERSVLQMQTLREKNPPKHFREGEVFPYLGQNYKLSLRYGEKLAISMVENEILFKIPLSETVLNDQARAIYFAQLQKTYKRTAQKLMTERVKLYQNRMQLFASSLRFGQQRSLWGSCSSRNKISLNYKLIVAPLDVIDYVVVHELAHIRHKNHSADFWSLVDKTIDHREKSKKWLRENVNCGEFLKS